MLTVLLALLCALLFRCSVALDRPPPIFGPGLDPIGAAKRQRDAAAKEERRVND